jgi:hypothetical protein
MSRYKDSWGNQELPGLTNEELLSDEFRKKFLNAENAEKNRQLAKDPQWLASVRRAANRWSSDPEWIEAQTKRNAELVNRPDWSEIKSRATETLKKRWQEDFEFRERMLAKNAEVTSSPEWLEAMRQGVAEANERYWASSEAQAERSRIAKEAAAKRDNKAIGEKHKQRYIDNPELREEQSKRSIEISSRPEVKEKYKINASKMRGSKEHGQKVKEGSAEHTAWLKTTNGKEWKSNIQKQNWANHKDTMCKAMKDRYTNDSTLATRISESLKNSDIVKEKAKKRQNKIQTPDGVFESRKAAAEFYGMKCPTGMNTRIKNHPGKYYYVEVGNGATKVTQLK